MEQVSFDVWWDEFVNEYKNGKEGYYTENRLLSYVSGLSHDKQSAFLDELTSVCIKRRSGWNIAAGVLEQKAGTKHRQRIYEYLHHLVR